MFLILAALTGYIKLQVDREGRRGRERKRESMFTHIRFLEMFSLVTAESKILKKPMSGLEVHASVCMKIQLV